MAITTLAGVRSGLQPPVYFSKNILNSGNAGVLARSDMWGTAGNPPAGVFDTTLNGVALSAPVTGALPFLNPPSGNCYLARFQANTSGSTGGDAKNTVTLCDRLWHNGGLDITGAASPQSITSPTWPARDINGATSGDGVFLACTLSVGATVTTPSPTITISYTNSAGVAGRTGTNLQALAMTASQAFGSYFIPIALQAGDTGVQSVQSFSISSGFWSVGTINICAYRPIAEITTRFYCNTAIDAITGGMPRLYNDSVLFFVVGYNGTQGTGFAGNIQYTFG